MTDLKLLPPGEKKVVAKTLYQMGWSSVKIEGWLGISDDTVRRASEQPTPDDLRKFEEEFTIAIQSEKQKGLALGIKRLIELIPKERRMESLVKGLEYLENKNKPNVAVQVNNFNADKYIVK